MITQDDIDAFSDYNKTCTACSVHLTDDNWYKSAQNKNYYTCISCHDKSNAKTNAIHNPLSMYVNGKYVSRKHPLYKPGKYKSFGDAAFSSLSNYVNVKFGYVYAIRNPAWPDWVKIGKAVDAEDRLRSYHTGSPMRDYELVHSVYFEDRNEAERKAHLLAASKTMHPWNKNDNGEWFRLTEEQAMEVLRELTLD